MNTHPIHIIGALKRYTDAYTVAKVTVGLGKVVKIIGICVGGGITAIFGLIALISMAAAQSNGGVAASGFVIGGMGVCFGVVAGLILFVFGVLVAAQGQTLMAALDTAVNSSPFLLDEEKAQAMSLRVIQESSSLPPSLPT